MSKQIKKNIIAIIPARGGSKGIPKKNIMDFLGKPLLAWSIEQALASQYINDVYVSSDDRQILKIAGQFGAKQILRPKKLATDRSSSEESLLHALKSIKRITGLNIDLVVFLQATSPLRTGKDIDSAIERIIADKADSLFSAARLDSCSVWAVKNGRLKSLTYDYKNRKMRQDRDPNFLENGSIYAFKPNILVRLGNRLGGKISIYTMPLWKSFEIDNYDDADICKFYMKNRILAAGPEKFSPISGRIGLIVYDFDGVLTDNTVAVRADGLETVKVSRADGLAISMIKKMNIPQVILTTEKNEVVRVRAKKLGLAVISGVINKRETLTGYCRDKKIPLKDVVYVGNDINDLDAMKACGYTFCPSDAYQEIKDIAGVVLDVPGGRGVVRNLIKYIKQKEKK